MNSEFDEMYQIVKEDRKLLGNRIEAQLMRYIQEEPIPVGEKIPNEFELAEKFGVGRSTHIPRKKIRLGWEDTMTSTSWRWNCSMYV